MYLGSWLSIVVLAEPGDSTGRTAYANQALGVLLALACAVMFPFVALHYVALLWFSVMFRHGFRQIARSSRTLGKRSLKRMSRCSPMLIQRWRTRELQCDAIVATALRLMGVCASWLLQTVRSAVYVHLSWSCSIVPYGVVLHYRVILIIGIFHFESIRFFKWTSPRDCSNNNDIIATKNAQGTPNGFLHDIHRTESMRGGGAPEHSSTAADVKPVLMSEEDVGKQSPLDRLPRANAEEGEGELARTAYKFTMQDIRDGSIVIHPQLFAMAMEAESDLPADVLATMSKPMCAVRTKGDGACAIHSIFGTPGSNQELLAPRARMLASDLLGESWPNLLSDGAAQQHVTAIQVSLWHEFVLPYLRGSPSVEGKCFWNALERKFPELAQEAKLTYAADESQVRLFDAKRAQALTSSRAFFHPDVEALYIRPLAIQCGYIPANVDVRALSQEEVERCREDENNAHCRSFLECVDDGGYVRGTRLPFPQHGPCCKYAALFDERPVFDSLRLAFLVQADPRSGVGLMLEAPVI